MIHVEMEVSVPKVGRNTANDLILALSGLLSNALMTAMADEGIVVHRLTVEEDDA